MLNFQISKCLFQIIIILFHLSHMTLSYSVDLSQMNMKTATESYVIYCDDVPVKELSAVLGSAYNNRYMSIEEPDFTEEIIDAKTGKVLKSKRSTGTSSKSFSVDADFAEDLSDDPAWDVTDHTKLGNDDKRFRRNINETYYVGGNRRYRRSVRRNRLEFGSNMENSLHGIDISLGGGNDDGTITDAKRPWSCDSKIVWLDLGNTYFPQYLRSVECTSGSCWYGHFVCKPRSFTVKILRRRSDECVMVKTGGKVGVDGLPVELRDKWVWEERALNFCCDCAMP